LEFDASLDLASYNLPKDAGVFIEAYRRTTVMRFSAGTVGSFRLPVSRELTDFDQPEGILFRVKVTSTFPDRGKLLAEADKIGFRPLDEINENRDPLLPVHAEELGAIVTKVDFSDGPVLLINKNLGDWREIARSDAFVSLVLPGALREILMRIFVLEQSGDEDDDSGSWQSKWVQFTKLLPGVEPPPGREADQLEFENWIDDVVEVFARRTRMFERFRIYWEREESE
jgi:hypothetical protein